MIIFHSSFFFVYTSHRFGRTAFIVFIGSIVIAGKWWANILVGLFTFFVGGINCCVICDHPAFRKGGKMATWGQDEVDAEIGGGGEPYAAAAAGGGGLASAVAGGGAQGGGGFAQIPTAHTFPEQIASVDQSAVEAAVAAAASLALAPSSQPQQQEVATVAAPASSDYGDFAGAGPSPAGFYDDAEDDDAAGADPYSGGNVAELDPYTGAPIASVTASAETQVNPFAS